MSLFSKSRTVASILEGVYAKIEELRLHGKEQHDLADNEAEEAQRIAAQSESRRKEAVRAELIAGRISNLLEG